ncbi:MAG: nucleotide exchange factor GrpE [Deltaproteobacteria bacterium]|nr:nucleotide exchange factor GrpE [Deltaproteobacteria bacterium]
MKNVKNNNKEANLNKNDDNSIRTKNSEISTVDPEEGSTEENKVIVEVKEKVADVSGGIEEAEQSGESGENAEESLAGEIDPLTEERDKLKDQLLRMAADFDNFRKRTRRDIEEVKVRAREDLLRELLPVFDNLRRAISASSEVQNTDSVIEGVQMVLKLFEDTGERLGLERIESLGQRFDPAIHDALQQIETSEYQPGTIVSEITPGYLFGKRLLRAALVVVARAPKQAETNESTDSAKDGPEEETPLEEGSDPESNNQSHNDASQEPRAVERDRD